MIFTVSEVNLHVNRLLGDEPLLSGIDIRGEISNLKVYDDGRAFFTLKDEGAAITCVCFEDISRFANVKNGDKVVVTGNINLYIRDGRYQLIVKKIEITGLGYWYQRFEALKNKLAAEGFFDAAHKKTLPFLPGVVGIVTSDKGAALQDMLKVLARRWPAAQVKVFPVLVQGAAAAAQISRVIDEVSHAKSVDVLIVGRGGGSIEDLWTFNEECVARSIYNCDIPIISAVGHETDFTIADFAADVRAATPSVAAELAVPSREEIYARIEAAERAMKRSILARLDAAQKQIDACNGIVRAAQPQRRLEEVGRKCGMLAEKINFLAKRLIEKREMDVLTLNDGLKKGIKRRLERADHLQAELKIKLDALDPLAVMSRGYAVITLEDGKVIGGVEELQAGYKVVIHMDDGSAGADITEVRYAKDK